MYQIAATAMKLIAGSEGGYSNHPNDPGGPTMKGVTLKNYQRYCATKHRPKPGVDQLKKISNAEVEEIFRDDYWNRVRANDLPAGIDYAAADFAFNSGPGQAAKELQRVVTALGYDAGGADGKIGNGTLSAVKLCVIERGEDEVINRYMDKRWSFMQGLKNFSSFKNGWRNRIADVRKNALSIAHGDPIYPSQDHVGGNAKADPATTRMAAVPGGASTMVTVGGACATGLTTAATSLLDNSAASGDTHLMLYAIIGFAVLTVVASVIAAIVLKHKPVEEGTV